MKKIFSRENLKKILMLFILLQPLLDTYILFDEITMEIFKISPSTVIRLIFIFIMAIFSIFIIKSKKQWKFYIVYCIVTVIYSFLHLYNAGQFNSLHPGNFNFSTTTELFYIIRMLIPLFLILLTSNIKISKKQFLRIINILVILFSGTIVITNILNISIGAYVTKHIEFNIFDWFINGVTKNHSIYDTATRGYFSFANTISCILFGFNFILFYQFIKEKKFKILILIIIQMLATFMLGTKVATLGFIISLFVIIVLYFYFSFKQKEIKFESKTLIILISLLVSWGIIFPFSPCYSRLVGTGESTKAEDYASLTEKRNILTKVNEDISILDDEEKTEYLKKFISKNYEKFNFQKSYITKKYPYNYDPIFWYDLFPISTNKKANNRFLVKTILDRLKEVNGNKIEDDLLGITYSRMSNISVLERDFVSQYYTLGIFGFVLFTLPYLLIIVLGIIFLLINFKSKKFNLQNICIILAITSAYFGAFYCGNTLDNLTFGIIYAFICGYFINNLFQKEKLKNDEITILALHLGYGGVEQYISSLCKMLKDDYKIKIISTYRLNDKPAFMFDDNIEITYLINDKPNKEEFKSAIRSKNILKVMKEAFKSIKILLLKYIRNILAIKNINSKYIITTRYFHNNLVNIFAQKDIIKIATEHNFHNNNNKYINKVVKSVSKFNFFVPVSNNLKEFYEKRLKNAKCVFIPNVLEVKSDKVSKLEDNVLINVGRMEIEKNQIELLKIVKEVKKEIPNIKLYLIGDGTLRNELKQKTIEYQIEDSVVFVGFITKDKLEEYYLKSKLFVMTSTTESFGIVLIEAQNYGVPCIAYDCADGAKELLKNNNGVLIPDMNKQLMVNKIIKLLNDKNKLQGLAHNGKENSDKYYIENIKKKWLKLLGDVNEKDN